ncbi:TPA: DUF1642 domain-containing protein [Streptococcus suis]|uniref:DUF1642 domain-containing protein n=1 Tax=Streptococcus suis TaxID=1307 RepID=UPI002AAEF343|nr:DUF1642 domain-containing protein [Streptococcus suis]
MNKQEAKQKLHNIAFAKMNARPGDLKLADVMQVIDQIDEPQKVVVSQVAVEYYNTFKDYGYSLVELLGDFCYQSTREKFPRLNELETWLYGNDEATNRQRELALATLILNGPDAVEIEQEKLYTVEFPTGQRLYKNHPNGSSKVAIVIKFAHHAEKDGHFTKKELEETGFGWVFDCDGVKVVEVE